MAWSNRRASLLLVALVWMVMCIPGIILGGYLDESAERIVQGAGLTDAS